MNATLTADEAKEIKGRVIADKLAQQLEDKTAGIANGIRWAKENAGYSEFVDLASRVEDEGISGAAEAIINGDFDSLEYEYENESVDWWMGFVEGALAIWDQVKE